MVFLSLKGGCPWAVEVAGIGWRLDVGNLFSLSLVLVSILSQCLLHPWVQGARAQASPQGSWFQRDLLRPGLCSLAPPPSSLPLPIPVPWPAWPLAHFCNLCPLPWLKAFPRELTALKFAG